MQDIGLRYGPDIYPASVVPEIGETFGHYILRHHFVAYIGTRHSDEIIPVAHKQLSEFLCRYIIPWHYGSQQ